MAHINVEVSAEAYAAAKVAAAKSGKQLKRWIEGLILDATRDEVPQERNDDDKPKDLTYGPIED